MTVMNSTISSSAASGATEQISKRFGVTNTELLILPTSTYLLGYTFGPLFFGPLSETIGRKPSMVGAFALFTMFSIATAVSPSFTALVFFRLLVGIGGSCPIAAVGG